MGFFEPGPPRGSMGSAKRDCIEAGTGGDCRATLKRSRGLSLTVSTAAAKPQDAKAKSAKKAALKGTQSHSLRKVRTSVSFHRPKTLRLSRDPKYPRKSVPHLPRMASEPETYLAVLKASYDYEPQADAEDELAVKENQLLFLLERTDDEYVLITLPCVLPFLTVVTLAPAGGRLR